MSDSFTDAGDAGDAGADSSDAAPQADTSVAPDAADAACQATTFTVFAEADGQFLSASTLNWGTLGIMGVRNDLGGPMDSLVRFDVSQLPPGAKLQSVKLKLPWGSLAKDCGNNACGSCASIDTAGTGDVYYLRSDWDELTATWFKRDAQNKWGADGALSSADRSTKIAGTFMHAAMTDATATIDPTELANFASWRQTNKISFLLQGEGSLKFLIETKESKALCPATGAGTSLTVAYCP